MEVDEAVMGVTPRISCWLPTQTLHRRVDALQRRLLVAALRVRRVPREPLDAYLRRRARTAAERRRLGGPWSMRQIRRAQAAS